MLTIGNRTESTSGAARALESSDIVFVASAVATITKHERLGTSQSGDNTADYDRDNSNGEDYEEERPARHTPFAVTERAAAPASFLRHIVLR